MRSILAGDETVGTKIRAGMPQPHRGVRDRRAVVAARRGDHACGRRVAKQQVGKGAAGLERAGVLQLFELEGQRERRQPEVGAARLDDWGDADIGRDGGVDALDGGSVDDDGHGD